MFAPDTFHRLIDDPTAADAICNRIVTGAKIINLQGGY
ncbi:unnamed protein product [Acidithrix sp. C25]|nr:unnamed protein product [Acidithrix sp. C25]